jgi:hypothetical protein
LNYHGFLQGELLPNILNIIFGVAFGVVGFFAWTRLEKPGQEVQALSEPTKEEKERLSPAENQKLAENGRLVKEWHDRKNAKSLVFLGFVFLSLLFFVNAFLGLPKDSVKNLISLHGFGWFSLVWIAAVGASLIYARRVYNIGQSAPRESSRTGYLDALKTLIATAGVATGVVVAALSKSLVSSAQIHSVDLAVTLLVISMVCCTCDLFWFNMLWDEARVHNGQLENPQLLFPLFLLWCGGVSFLMGFCYLARLAYNLAPAS